MKKLFALVFLAMAAFTFSPMQTFAAEGDTTEPVVTEPEVDTTEPVVTEPADYQEEVDALTADMNEIIAQVFTYIGGFAGISAVLAFVFKFIRDRGIMSKLKEEVAEILTGSTDVVTSMNSLIETVKSYTDRNAVLEKSVIHLITISNLDASLKEQVITGLNNDTIQVQDVLNAGLLQIQQEVAERVNVQAQVDAAATSLLEQLSKDEV